LCSLWSIRSTNLFLPWNPILILQWTLKSYVLFFLIENPSLHHFIWQSTVSDTLRLWQICILVHVIFSFHPNCCIFTLFIHQKLHILSSLQSRDSRFLLVLTLLFTFQFNHLQHHDSSILYIFNAYDLSVF